jgi:phosphopantothenoylcysteine decarboxylase/phosphopantothenate--cysteine ligase
MDGGMLEHASTQENLQTLTRRGATIAGPAEGRLASGLSGKGRLLEPEEILGHIRLLLGRKGKLAGKKVVITAGGTQEPLDPVRVLTNRSSGKQGYALAQSAVDAGATVTLISAPTALTPPVGACVVEVETAREMRDAALRESAEADALIMAAAVADFRPHRAADTKMKTRDGVPQIELEATDDILKTVVESGRPRIVIGFAAETNELIKNATQKLHAKKLDLIVANDVSSKDSGFSTDNNRVTLIDAAGKAEALPLASKAEVADRIVERLAGMLES